MHFGPQHPMPSSVLKTLRVLGGPQLRRWDDFFVAASAGNGRNGGLVNLSGVGMAALNYFVNRRNNTADSPARLRRPTRAVAIHTARRLCRRCHR